MQSLTEYIIENTILETAKSHIVFEGDDTESSDTAERANIKFTIWTDTNTKGTWVDDNESYQKIEYNYESDDKKINAQFLLGYKDYRWKLWMGKRGAVSYDDDPFKDLETEKFSDAILKALDEIQKVIQKIKDDPSDWVQYYV